MNMDRLFQNKETDFTHLEPMSLLEMHGKE